MPLTAKAMGRAWGAAALAAAAALAVTALAPPQAEGKGRGRRAEDVLKKRIIVSTKPFPAKFKSDAAMVGYMNRVHKRSLVAVDGKWKFYYMSFFANPLEDIQVKVNFYDLTDGKRFLLSADQYAMERGQRILSADFELSREEIPSNHQVLRAVVHRGKILATTTIFMVDHRKFDGKVDFDEP